MQIICHLKEDCNEDTLNGLQAVLLMLPGATVIDSGLELGIPPSSIFQWDSQEKNQGIIFKSHSSLIIKCIYFILEDIIYDVMVLFDASWYERPEFNSKMAVNLFFN